VQRNDIRNFPDLSAQPFDRIVLIETGLRDGEQQRTKDLTMGVKDGRANAYSVLDMVAITYRVALGTNRTQCLAKCLGLADRVGRIGWQLTPKNALHLILRQPGEDGQATGTHVQRHLFSWVQEILKLSRTSGCIEQNPVGSGAHTQKDGFTRIPREKAHRFPGCLPQVAGRQQRSCQTVEFQPSTKAPSGFVLLKKTQVCQGIEKTVRRTRTDTQQPGRLAGANRPLVKDHVLQEPNSTFDRPQL
jgi:hypothetical protein